ncbi:formate dehydrogenase accessory sulfurtransferase FdhD [Chloroflexota bacterium]
MSEKKMADIVEKLHIRRVAGRGEQDIEDVVIKELPLTIILNNKELVTLLCTPADLKYLAIGFLFSEGLLGSKDEIKKVTVDDQRGVVRVETGGDNEPAGELAFKRFITSGCGRGSSFYSAADVQGQSKIESQIRIPALSILTMVKTFQSSSQNFKLTGGVHSAALCDTSHILIFAEDIGRHNAVDKILGECIFRAIPTDDGIMITSGRISSEILLKVAKRNIPILISRSAPTNLGVRLADELGVTLIGFVRAGRMNVYSHGWRVVTDGE